MKKTNSVTKVEKLEFRKGHIFRVHLNCGHTIIRVGFRMAIKRVTCPTCAGDTVEVLAQAAFASQAKMQQDTACGAHTWHPPLARA